MPDLSVIGATAVAAIAVAATVDAETQDRVSRECPRGQDKAPRLREVNHATRAETPTPATADNVRLVKIDVVRARSAT